MSINLENDERIIKALSYLGMTPEEIKLYLFLIVNGSATIDDIPLAIPHKIINAIESLKRKGWIREIYRGGERYYVPVDPYYLIGREIENLKRIVTDLEYTLNELKRVGSFGIVQSFSDSDSFYRKLKLAIRNARREVAFLTRHFMLAYKVLDAILDAIKREISVLVIGEIISEEAIKYVKEMLRLTIKVKHSVGTVLRCVIIDDDQAFIAVRDPTDPNKHIGVWINSEDFVKPLKETFIKLWNSGVDAKERLKALGIEV